MYKEARAERICVYAATLTLSATVTNISAGSVHSPVLQGLPQMGIVMKGRWAVGLHEGGRKHECVAAGDGRNDAPIRSNVLSFFIFEGGRQLQDLNSQKADRNGGIGRTMTVNPAFNIENGYIPDHDETEPGDEGKLSSTDPEGAFNAALYYIAADLQELAKVAPPYKAEPLSALVRLMRALADT